MRNSYKGYLAAILAAVCYGTNPLGALPLYSEGITSTTALTYRYGLAVLLFAIIMLIRRESFGIKRGHAIRFATLGAMFSVSSLTLYTSFHYMAAGIACTILFVYPVMTALLMTALFHEHITKGVAIAIALATFGVVMLYHGDGTTTLSTNGFSLVMLSALSYAFYIISVNRWKIEMSAIKFTFWILVFCTFFTILFALFTGESIQMLHTPKAWGCAILLAVLPTVMSLLFMNIGIRLIGSTPSAIMGALEPVTAVCIGIFLFNEHLTTRLTIGIALILTAVLIVILNQRKTAKKTKL